MEQAASACRRILRRHHDVRIDIYKQHAEGDGHQKERFETFLDSKVQKHAGHADHKQVAAGQI